MELRAPDVQTDPSYTVALAALVQCLVARAGMEERPAEDAVYNAENKWRAVRYGMDADSAYDFVAGRVMPARSMARGLVEELRPVAQGPRLRGRVGRCARDRGARHRGGVAAGRAQEERLARRGEWTT